MRVLGRNQEVAIRLNKLAIVYSDTERYAEAETRLREVLWIFQEDRRRRSSRYANSLLNLAVGTSDRSVLDRHWLSQNRD